MAEIMFTNAHVSVNGVDLSDHVRTVRIPYGAEVHDKTAMGDQARRRIVGLTDFSLELEFNQDFVASEVDATLFPLVGAAAFPIIVRPDAGAVAVGNPQFTGNVVLESYPPLDGEIGTLLTASATMPGDGVLARATS